MTARFGPFALDAETRQLRRGTAVIHLTPKAFDLLQPLLAEAPRVVCKRELHERLWPSVFVSDASLTGLIVFGAVPAVHRSSGGSASTETRAPGAGVGRVRISESP